jgi:putative transposase
MKRNRFTEEQIIGILKEHEARVSVADLYRKRGVGDAIGGKVNGNKTKPPPNKQGRFFSYAGRDFSY